MATYKGEKGFTIQTIAGDPPSPILGQVWYNTTSNVLKGYLTVTGAWSSGGNLNTGRASSAGAGTSQTTGLCIAGHGHYPLAYVNYNESYNGSAWSEENNLNTARYSQGGCGTQTAAITMSGYANAYPMKDETEIWNGTSWTEVNNVLTGRKEVKGCGTTAAAILPGGNLPPSFSPTVTALNESWDGTSWSEVNNIPTPTMSTATLGTQTAAIMAGGYTGSYVGTSYGWDGTCWTAGNNLNQLRANTNAGCGTSTDGMIVGGFIPPYAAQTETFDGTSWTEVADLPSGTYDGSVASNSPSGNSLYVGGQAAPAAYNNLTEEWTSGANVVTFTSS